MLQKQTLTVPEAVRSREIGRQTAYISVGTGSFPSVNIGCCFLVPNQALEIAPAADRPPAPSGVAR